jgi:acetyl-CoA acetyltransferase
MDQAPYLLGRGRWGYRMGDGQLFDSMLRDGLNDAFSDQHSGWHTEDLVEKYQVTREAQDRWALRSQERFAAAQKAGHFNSQIVPVEVPGKKGPTVFDTDEGNRPETTLEILAKLKPAFRPDGTITAGNAPGLNDGAAAMVLADAAWAGKRGLAPKARLVAYGIGAVEPGMFGLGPIPAVRQALARAGWEPGSVERVEINEAFQMIESPAQRLSSPELSSVLRRLLSVSLGDQADSVHTRRHLGQLRAQPIPYCNRRRHPYRAPSYLDAGLRRPGMVLDRVACRPVGPHHCGRAPSIERRNRAPVAPEIP